MVEPWHWRYLWVDMATRLHNLGWTYTEYIKFYESMLLGKNTSHEVFLYLKISLG
jgi:hypothetical protein